ncbi:MULTISPECIES: hypothetical protein [Streptomyces]|uniref:hypothetical protein n=1 Tax=Streptomyces TaxID=1883 RepID=UPI000690D32E|nr:MULTISPECIES: hypothetical protein [Streptomyces]
MQPADHRLRLRHRPQLPWRAPPRVTYTLIATRYDEVVTPYTSSFLAAAPNVTDQRIQDFCPDDSTEHLGISYDPVATRLVLDALDPAHARRPAC